MVDGKLLMETIVPDDATDDMRKAFLGPPTELVAVGDDQFAVSANPVTPVIDVRRTDDGGVDGIVTGMRFVRRSA